MSKEIITSPDYKDFITKIKQENFNWGDNIIGQISKDLIQDFGRGFSKRNIFRMRKFYLIYKDNSKVPLPMAQISWLNNIIILETNA